MIVWTTCTCPGDRAHPAASGYRRESWSNSSPELLAPAARASTPPTHAFNSVSIWGLRQR